MHTLTIEGVVIEDPTFEKIKTLFPEFEDEYINGVLASYDTSDKVLTADFDEGEALIIEERNAINRWRDEQFQMPVYFDLQGRTFKASIDFVNILKAYKDFLPEGSVWTDEGDSDLALTTETVVELLQAMQEAISMAYSAIHTEARKRKDAL